MKLIYKITDIEIGEKPIEMKKPRLRLGARGIVIKDTKQLNVPLK